MLTVILDLLTPEQVQEIRRVVDQASFADGKFTAGRRAQRVKHNEQMKKETDAEREIGQFLGNVLMANKLFRRQIQPKRILDPLISRYTIGMEYGFHIDNALMNKPQGLRTDVAVTIFLNSPADYDGGELLVDSPFGEQEVKLPDGSAVCYPASTLHRVTPVTRGERLAAITWVQSYVRDPARREILADIDNVYQHLTDTDVESEATDLAYKTYENLLRMWAEA